VNLRQNPAHFLRCKQGITWRHNQLKDPLCRLLKSVGLSPELEVPGLCSNPNLIMDVVEYNYRIGGQALLLDISVAGTSSDAYRARAARDALHAAKTREAEKHIRYHSGEVGSNSFVPFVVQEFGSLGPEATRWLSQLLHHRAQQCGVSNVKDWVSARQARFLTELSVSLQAAQFGKFQLAAGRSSPFSFLAGGTLEGALLLLRILLGPFPHKMGFLTRLRVFPGVLFFPHLPRSFLGNLESFLFLSLSFLLFSLLFIFHFLVKRSSQMLKSV